MRFWVEIIGVVLVLEGIPWFLSPSGMRNTLRQMMALPDRFLRPLGLAMMLLGLLLVHLAVG